MWIGRPAAATARIATAEPSREPGPASFTKPGAAPFTKPGAASFTKPGAASFTKPGSASFTDLGDRSFTEPRRQPAQNLSPEPCAEPSTAGGQYAPKPKTDQSRTPQTRQRRYESLVPQRQAGRVLRRRPGPRGFDSRCRSRAGRVLHVGDPANFKGRDWWAPTMTA